MIRALDSAARAGYRAGVFSSRLLWDQAPNPLTLAQQQRSAVGTSAADLLDLTVGNPTSALPHLYDAPLRAALGSLADPAGLRYEPTPRGLLSCRRAIAAYYARRGFVVDPEHLVLCASTSEAYSWLFQLLCDPGDAVLFPQPSYPLIDFLARLNAVQVRSYPLRFCVDHFALDVEGLAATTIAPGAGGPARALIAISPNNPTGSVLRRDELAQLRQHCVRRDLALIVDEVFSDYLLPGPTDATASAEPSSRIASLLGEPAGDSQPLSFVLSGFSKVLGLPQLKLGWIHVGGPEPLRTQAQDRLELVADTFLSVNTPVQLAAEPLLQRQDCIAAALRQHVRDNLQTLTQTLAGSAVTPLPVEAGWYAILRLPAVQTEDEWTVTLLERDDVLVHPGYFFDLLEPGKVFVVVSLLTPADSFRRGLARLRDRVAQVLSA